MRIAYIGQYQSGNGLRLIRGSVTWDLPWQHYLTVACWMFREELMRSSGFCLLSLLFPPSLYTSSFIYIGRLGRVYETDGCVVVMACGRASFIRQLQQPKETEQSPKASRLQESGSVASNLSVSCSCRWSGPAVPRHGMACSQPAMYHCKVVSSRRIALLVTSLRPFHPVPRILISAMSAVNG